jgi:hypothetical protein
LKDVKESKTLFQTGGVAQKKKADELAALAKINRDLEKQNLRQAQR